ncbi:MAG: PDZ domain-containing protein [Chloroflexi bacterium]|nr:PDZ domain-containing protein [Chloroflexota bacterium]
MEQSNSLSIVALIAAIVAIGLGLAALILALDDDDPRFAIGGPITIQPQFGEGRPGPDGPRLPFEGQDQPRFDAPPSGARLGIQVEASDAGLIVSGVVPGSPADAAGLEAGDVITSIGDRDVRSLEDALRVLAASEPGQTLPLTYERDGETHSASVELGSAPADRSPFRRSSDPADRDDSRERAQRARDDGGGLFEA